MSAGFIHHFTNGVVVAIPVMAYITGAGAFFTATTAFLATCYYLKFFYQDWKAKRERHNSGPNQ